MNSLLKFIIRYHAFFLFLLLETGSMVLLFSSQSFQRSIMLNSANSAVASIYQTANSVVEFFKMKSDNARLAEENARLLDQINNLENRITMMEEQQAGVSPIFTPAEHDIHYIAAKVINNTTNRQRNYMTINKGKRDGVEVGMGVVSSAGAVGVVKTVSDKFAVVVPILNPDLQVNCRFKTSGYAGPLVWDGIDYRYANLEDIARHVDFNDGDTLVTSGLTSTFPRGINVGVVEESRLEASDAYYYIRVRLMVNFRTLTYVQVLKNANFDDWKAIEQQQ